MRSGLCTTLENLGLFRTLALPALSMLIPADPNCDMFRVFDFVGYELRARVIFDTSRRTCAREGWDAVIANPDAMKMNSFFILIILSRGRGTLV
jgi:hypothetical protein